MVIDKNKASGVITSAQLIDDELFKDITGASAVFSMGKNIGAMPKGQTDIPIPETLITAGFVSGNMGKKPVSSGAIGVRNLKAGKIAAIVLIPDDVIADSDIDLWGTWIRPNIPNAFGVSLDAATLFGAGKPDEWTGFQKGLVPQAVERGNTVSMGSDIYQSIMGTSGLIHKVNEDGFSANGFIGDSDIEAILRGAVDSNNRPLYNSFLDPISAATREAINGRPYFSLQNGAWYDTLNNSLLIGGDFAKLIYSIREEINWRISKEATVELPTGQVVNCFQQNVTAFLMEMRVGAAVLNPPTRKNPDEKSRFPFAVLTNGGELEKINFTIEPATTANSAFLSIMEPLAAGHKRKYIVSESETPVSFDQDLTTGWTDLPANSIASGLQINQYITLAEVDADNKAKASGTKLVSALGGTLEVV